MQNRKMSKIIEKEEKELDMKEIDGLYKAILSLKNVEECKRFFRDLLTLEEIQEAARRWRVAKMLAKGVPFLKIEDETKMSSATISRVNYWLHHGAGGYKLLLKRLRLA